MSWWRTLTPLGRWALGIGLALLLALAVSGVLLWNAWQSGAAAKTEAKLNRNQTGAALASGADAVETLGRTQSVEVQVDVITRENDRAINTAPGAAATVDPAAHSAGLASVCRRAANRGKPECLQPTDPE